MKYCFYRLFAILLLVSSIGSICPGSDGPSADKLTPEQLAFKLCQAAVRGELKNEDDFSDRLLGCSSSDPIPTLPWDNSALICDSKGPTIKKYISLMKEGGVQEKRLTACLAEGRRIRGAFTVGSLSTGVVAAIRTAVETGPCQGLITPWRKKGDTCTSPIECEGDLACTTIEKDPTRLRCRDGFGDLDFCRSDSDCTKGFGCRYGVCQLKTLILSSFGDIEDGGDCEEFGYGLQCKNPCSRCVDDKSGGRQCLPFGGKGQPCGKIQSCLKNLFCDDDTHQCSDQNAPNNACSENTGCIAGYICENEKCMRSPVIGEKCGYFITCALGFCDEDICTEGKENDSCAKDSGCLAKSGLKCIAGKCAPAKGVGEACAITSGNRQCDDGLFCPAGKCALQKQPGENCHVKSEDDADLCGVGVCVTEEKGTSKGICLNVVEDTPGIPSDPLTFGQFVLLGA